MGNEDVRKRRQIFRGEKKSSRKYTEIRERRLFRVKSTTVRKVGNHKMVSEFNDPNVLKVEELSTPGPRETKYYWGTVKWTQYRISRTGTKEKKTQISVASNESEKKATMPFEPNNRRPAHQRKHHPQNRSTQNLQVDRRSYIRTTSDKKA